MHCIRATGIIYCVTAVHHWKKPNISLMGDNCCRVGSDAFICTEERSYVHPVITVTQQTLANVGTAEQPSSSRSPEMPEFLESCTLSQWLALTFRGGNFQYFYGAVVRHRVLNFPDRESRISFWDRGIEHPPQINHIEISRFKNLNVDIQFLETLRDPWSSF